MDLQSFTRFEQKMQQSVGKVIVGKPEAVRQLVIALIAGGHVLLEDLPGTGKTMMLRAFSRSIGGTFRRIQCTPDLMPSDLTGTTSITRRRVALNSGPARSLPTSFWPTRSTGQRPAARAPFWK